MFRPLPQIRLEKDLYEKPHFWGSHPSTFGGEPFVPIRCYPWGWQRSILCVISMA